MASNPAPVNPPIPPQSFVDPTTGKLTAPAYRYLWQLNQKTAGVTSGEVATPPAGGLAGGGFPADGGISLSIADNGVTNGKFRQSLGTSIVGRYANSTGNVADIRAVQDNVVLTRAGNTLAFRASLDEIPVGLFTAAPLVNTEQLIVATDPPASASATGTEGTITWDSGFLYVCVATDTWCRVAIATW